MAKKKEKKKEVEKNLGGDKVPETWMVSHRQK